MYGYIYFTENLINGKCYIGKHVKKTFDVHYKGSGIVLKSAIKNMVGITSYVNLFNGVKPKKNLKMQKSIG